MTNTRRRSLTALVAATSAVCALVAGPSAALADDSSTASAGYTVTNAVFEWQGNPIMQGTAMFGGSNYFSAGFSDGQEKTYKAELGNVHIVNRVGTKRYTPTWANHNDFASASDGYQIVEITGGEGKILADGTGEISWKGQWSVNYYGGLVPFAIKDPTLVLHKDGSADINVELSGYGSSMKDPSKRELIEGQKAVLAHFSKLTVDKAKGFKVKPDYYGVKYDIPKGDKDVYPQDRTGDKWGSWPKSFVDFQLRTGLSSYWYSSGLSADPSKPPYSVKVDFSKATIKDIPIPTLTLASPTAKEHGTVTVNVKGLKAKETYAVELSPKHKLGEITTDANGAGSATFTLPPGVSGEHTVTVGDLSAPLKITPTPQEIKLSATTVKEGGSVAVDVKGLEPTTEYKVLLHSDPFALGTLTTDADGSASGTFTLPKGVSGEHTIMVGDLKAALTITAAPKPKPTDKPTTPAPGTPSGHATPAPTKPLPATGADVLGLTLAALMLAALGGGLIVRSRRA